MAAGFSQKGTIMSLAKIAYQTTCMVFWGLLGLMHSAQATTFNAINTPDLEHMDAANAWPTSSGGFLFFRQDGGQNVTLINLNLSSLNSHELITLDTMRYNTRQAKFFELAGGQILMFIRARNPDQLTFNSGQLYTTDGTSPMQFITPPNLNPNLASHTVIQGQLFATVKDGTKILTTGLETKLLPVPGQVRPLCLFADRSLLLAVLNGVRWELKLFKEGVLQTANTNWFFQAESEPAHTNHGCVFKVTDRLAQEHAYLYYDLNGESIELDREDDWIMAFGTQQFLATKSSLNPLVATTYQLLDAKSLEVLNETERLHSNLHHVETNGQRIYLYFEKSSNFGPQRSVIIMSDQLVDLSPEIELSGLEQLLYSPNLDYDLNPATLDLYASGQLVNSMPLNRHMNRTFYHNPDSETLLFVLDSFLKPTGPREVFFLSELPAIGEAINGAWVDMRYFNQGLVINSGRRGDGSHYVFLTFYLYRDGQALWLAGDQNYTPGQASIDIDLFEYNGIDFLETNNPPDRQSFGTLSLTFTDCGRLSGSLTHGSQAQEFTFLRIDDIAFNHQCVSP
jgi:hypothetical protein